MGKKVDAHIGGYHLTEAIGTGGMGSVFRAVVEEDGKPVPKGATVAVKLMHPHLRTVREFVDRFHREAKLAATIDHPNVVRVLDEGVHENRHHYIVMELAEGLKLTRLISENQPLLPRQTIKVMNQLCEALKAAGHIVENAQPAPPTGMPAVSAVPKIRSLVHRDIKPDNIIIRPLDAKQLDTMTRTGDRTALTNFQVKLLDFGLAKDVKALSTILSQTGQSLGTPAYMSPEQCSGGDVDQRSDIYSLGVVAYNMITGTQPFKGPTTVAYAQQHAEEIPPDILNLNPLCPTSLADCIYRCMAKDPRDRYSTPQELQADLARVATGQGVASIHRFRKKGSFSAAKVAMLVGMGILACLLVIAGVSYLMTDRARSGLDKAIQQADVAIAAKDYVGAKKILEDAITAFPDRADKTNLIAPAYKRLNEISDRETEQARAEKEAAELATKKKHEQEAIATIAAIKARIAAGDYSKAIDAAHAAIKTYADTPSGKELPSLLGAATEKLKGEKAAQTAKDQAEKDRLAAEAKARHERFIKYRDEGDTAFNATVPNYSSARSSYEKALAEEPDAGIKTRLETCMERTTRQPLAVIDFEEKGDVAAALNVKDAGQTMAELVLTRFGQDRFQLIERSQLANLLREMDLTMAVVRDRPEKVYGRIKGVKYLVLGRVSKLGNIVVTARIVNVVTGAVCQTAEVQAEDARGIQNALTELVKILQMTAAEKKAYVPKTPHMTTVAPRVLTELRPEETISSKELTLYLSNSVTMQLVLIPSGKFMMGSPASEKDRQNEEGPQHEVTISKPFYMGVYTVTQEQWTAVMGTAPWNDNAYDRSDHADAPSVISWDDARKFCKKFSEKSGKKVSLPTEAQWEYACRAGTTTRFYYGDDEGYSKLGDYAWISKDNDRKTHPVGQKKPNAWGLYDMCGNSQWCLDWYEYYANAKKTDPIGPASGTERVLRGGWSSNGMTCRSAFRRGGDPAKGLFEFRIVVATEDSSSTTTQAATGSSPGAVKPSPPQTGKELELDLGNNITMKLVLLPAGQFLMGSSRSENDFDVSEGPQHEVRITKPFYMGVYTVTQEQYIQVVGTNPSQFRGAQNPVENVSWQEAVDFCKKLTEKSGKKVSLPTEAQWEYACRAENQAKFSFGDDKTDLGDYAWYSENSGRKTHAVGQKKPNAWGLYDMQGNVSQWCSDWYADSYAKADKINPQGPASGWHRVLRGGSWYAIPQCCHSASRSKLLPNLKNSTLGFRVVVGVTKKASDLAVAPAASAVSQPDPKAAGEELVLDLSKEVTMTFVLIPAGKFLMGNPYSKRDDYQEEGPQHAVTISKPFYMGVYTVTRGQFAAFVADTGYRTDAEKVYDVGKKTMVPSWKKLDFQQTDDHPVVCVSHNDAVAFCQWLSRKTGKTVSLPTEAQWEYACRAGSTTRFYYGDDENYINDYAWCDRNAERRTHPVGQKKPNDWALYDMHGNVWQWCSDWYVDSYANAEDADPEGPVTGTNRVLRGGSCYGNPLNCRSTSRLARVPNYKIVFVGFRVVVDMTKASEPAVAPAAPAVSQTNQKAAEKELSLDPSNNVSMKLALIPAGKFMMGSPDNEKGRNKNEGPQYKVTISKPFYMGIYAVTQEQWTAVMGTTPWKGKECAQSGRKNAASYISWNDATSFCKKISQKTGKTVSLPTEAQWEYACRAGSTTRFYYGDDNDYSNLGDYAWYTENAWEIGEKYPHPVGRKKPNAWGLYDMHGNVFQWCSDWYDEGYNANAEKTDPTGPASGTFRVLRGGSFISDDGGCRSAYRSSSDPAVVWHGFGFRVVVAPGL